MACPGPHNNTHMKKMLTCLAVLFSYMMLNAQELNVMTFNIRLNVYSDSANSWPFREKNLAAQILFHEVHLLGVQEALHGQMMNLQDRLKQYRYIGVGRDDGKEKGEYSAIFYDTTRLQALQSSTFWLSETPAVPGSKSWDAAITRIVTWGQFRDRKTRQVFFAFNTHFDHIGQVARRESARLLLRKIKEIAGAAPVVLTGDFNSKPAEDPIRIITAAADPLHLSDTKELSETLHYGPDGTFNGFQSQETGDEPIDFIFTKGKWKVRKHASISQTWHGRFASDHFAVLAVMAL